ncbi:DNA sulfur modification protein DndB [Trichocoleus sp. FACHB-591]|uniref:DNA sulfur modification protein DndB n=1 Tax=Trichocoleus sp. FACHB-591 TaxID=2692872 RepID=UPI0016862E02|nr:DNA sulfur modification protein DndB [Trichocoleus sp. FACHB-591]MBD2094471.1 DNA sulfur modification protein DndB [Trichocoleus sp. FACHB-591]
MALPFEYVFPAIRGVQAGREYYVSMCPVRLIPKLFSFNDEEIPAELRAQRTLNKVRVPDIAQYILDNSTSYVFSAITVSVNASISFERAGSEDIGLLKVPMDGRFIINDGQHRRAAFEMALKENPDIGDETIAVVFFLDIGLKRSQQMFTDLNRYAARPDPSLNILYDHRDRKAVLSKAVIKGVKVFDKLTDSERSSLPPRSSKLFTLSGIYTATNMLLSNHKDVDLDKQTSIAAQYWNAVSAQMTDWQNVLQKKVAAGELRRDYVHSHAVSLVGLGGAGAALIALYPDDWADRLKPLREINWERANPAWQNSVISGGSVHNNRTSRGFMIAYLKKALGLPLASEEDKLIVS